LTTKLFSPLSFLLLFLDLVSGIRDQDPGSGINIPDPQRWQQEKQSKKSNKSSKRIKSSRAIRQKQENQEQQEQQENFS
jgi:hypothetical protein